MRYLSTVLLLPLAALLGCGGDDSKSNDPAPATDAQVEVRLTNIGKTGADCTSFLLSKSIFDTNKTGTTLYWNQDIEAGTNRYKVGALKRGTTYYLSVTYDTGGLPGYVRPTASQYIEAEILVDGTSKGTVRADAATFNNPANYWGDDAVSKDRVGAELRISL